MRAAKAKIESVYLPNLPTWKVDKAKTYFLSIVQSYETAAHVFICTYIQYIYIYIFMHMNCLLVQPGLDLNALSLEQLPDELGLIDRHGAIYYIFKSTNLKPLSSNKTEVKSRTRS